MAEIYEEIRELLLSSSIPMICVPYSLSSKVHSIHHAGFLLRFPLPNAVPQNAIRLFFLTIVSL